jgi:hypothetical protein
MSKTRKDRNFRNEDRKWSDGYVQTSKDEYFSHKKEKKQRSEFSRANLNEVLYKYTH